MNINHSNVNQVIANATASDIGMALHIYGAAGQGKSEAIKTAAEAIKTTHYFEMATQRLDNIAEDSIIILNEVDAVLLKEMMKIFDMLKNQPENSLVILISNGDGEFLNQVMANRMLHLKWE
ncbi:hypothetical protein D3C81_384710 [compost metagenome]